MKSVNHRLGILALTLFVVTACHKSTQMLIHDDLESQYLFLGHIYETNERIDHRIEKLDLGQYEQIWLGGDICAETTRKESTVEHINEVFDLDRPQTHWALGNHDIRNGNIEWITDRTGRPTYYTAHFDGITLMVLNTNFSHGGIYNSVAVNLQYDMIREVCDTIQASSHLVVLSHNASWNGVDGIDHTSDFANANFSFLRYKFNPAQDYAEAVYPLLVEVRKRGIEVLHIAGDYGQKAATYHYLTTDDIHLLGSGITANTDWNQQFPTAGMPDTILILYHNIKDRTIRWEFEELN